MVINSRFEKFNKKLLLKISYEIIKKDFDYIKPYREIRDNLDILSKILKYFGEEYAEYVDVEFFAKFIILNEKNILDFSEKKDEKLKNQIHDSLIIPSVGKYKIEYLIDERIARTVFYEDVWESYDEDWVRDSVMTEWGDGDWSAYDGDLISTDVYDHELIGSPDITQVNRIEESLDSLNKESLLKLKKLIERKLRN